MREIVANNKELIRGAVEFVSRVAGRRDVVVVGASRGAVDDVCRWACEGALAGVYRYDFRSLVAALSERAIYQRDLAPLPAAARETLAAAVARQVQLQYLEQSAQFPGFARALGRTLEDLRLNRIAAGVLREVGRSGPDLALVLERWNRELAERGFADYAERVELAILEAARAAEAGGRSLLILDLDVHTVAERELLEVLESRAVEMLHLTVDRRQAATTNALTSVQRYAVSADAAPAREADDSVSFFSASSEALEFVEIARRVVGSGVPFDQIAVLLRNPARHLPLLEEAFSRAGIPVWMEEGTPRRDNSGRAFLTLLRCREEQFATSRFSEFLSLARLPGQDGERQAPTGFWERLLNEAAVIGGRERWDTRTAAALAQAAGEYERAPSEGLLRRIDALESLREFALPIIGHLAALPERAVWREWIGSFDELATIALEDPRTIHRALEELAPVADLGPVPVADTLRVMEQLLSTWRQEPEGQRYGKVFASSIDAARGMSFRLVFVPGLNESLFPRTAREDPLLLDEQRRALSMPASGDDRELLDKALCAAAERAVFSWARIDLATGRERIPSFFAAEVMAAARGADADMGALLMEAKAQVSSKIGWSAPEEPEASIDDSEFDLSTFRQAARQKRSMAWLREVNSHTVRAIGARRQRWGRSWTEADGLHGDFDMQAAIALKKWELVERAYSPTSLNQFARCPFRFYLSAIVGLRELERPEALDRLDPLTRGHLYHRVLFRYFGSPGRSLDDVLRELAEEAAEKLAPPIRSVWSTEIEKLRADLHAWLNCHDPEWQPQFIELAFGLPEREECDENSVPEPVTIGKGWPLRGSIDLVERHSDGQRLRILDHKTGTPGKKDWGLCVGKGEVLQPVLYALALEALGYGAPVSAALSWATLRGGFRRDEIGINEDARAQAGKVLQCIDAHVHRGFLPAAPRADACRNCEYQPVCGPWEEVRTALKEQGDLRQLKEIRGLR